MCAFLQYLILMFVDFSNAVKSEGGGTKENFPYGKKKERGLCGNYIQLKSTRQWIIPISFSDVLLVEKTLQFLLFFSFSFLLYFSVVIG